MLRNVKVDRGKLLLELSEAFRSNFSTLEVILASENRK